jgi:putative ABC transport system permease protein
VIILSWSTFRERWQLFMGALVAVALGVSLVQASLLTLASAADPVIPGDLSVRAELELRNAYTGTISLAAIIMVVTSFVAVFVVGSTFAFTVAQRRRDLALLRLVGASRQQVRRLLLGEAMLLGVLGAGAGVGLGLLASAAEARLFARYDFAPDGFTVAWHWWALAAALVVGVGVSVVGCWVASRRASRVRPLHALRDAAGADRVMTASRWVIGVSATAATIALLIGTASADGNAAMDAAIPGCLLSVIALSALSPVVTPAVGRVLEAVSRLARSEGKVTELIHANLRDGVRRTASTAAPIILLVGLVVGLAGSIGVIDAGRRSELSRTLSADLVVTSNQPIGDRLAGIEGVLAVSEEAALLIEAEDRDSDGAASYDPVDAVAVDPTSYPVAHGITDVSGEWAELSGDAAVVGRSYASRYGLEVGGTQRVRIDGVRRDLRVVAILPVTMAGADLLVPLSTAPQGLERTYLIEASDLDVAALEAELATAGVDEATNVTTAGEWIRGTTTAQREVSQNLILVILGLATVYIVLAVINAVVIAGADRRVEFATARLTGLTRALVVRTALTESLVVVLIGVLLGVLAATSTLLGVASGVSSIVGTRVFTFPWSLLLATALGTTVIVAVTSVLTAIAATRQSAIEVAGARE